MKHINPCSREGFGGLRRDATILLAGVAALLLIVPMTLIGGNPLVPGKGLADPHITIHGDHAYLFSGHDPNLAEWWVWGSADLVNWQMESVLRPEDTFIGKPYEGGCWASFGTFKNGRCFWYFSAGGDQVGVVVADTAAGPWGDPLRKPLLPRGIVPVEARDPDVFVDDNGKSYIVFGVFDFYIVALSEDMISLAETPKLVQLDRKFGPYGSGRTDDKPSLHKRNGIYYLSWCSFYATSDNLYGPYTYKGSVVAPQYLSRDFRQDDLWYDRHGNFFTWNNQWFYIVHDLHQLGGQGRTACITYVHYRDNGEIEPVVLDKIGVGQYNANAGRIEAEDYFRAAGAEKKQHPVAGFEMRNLRDGSFLIYPNVMNLRQNAQMAFRVSSRNPAGGTIEVREKGPEGRVLGSCKIPTDMQQWDLYRTISCALQNEAGTNDLCLLFKGSSEEIARLDWFEFP